MLLEFAIADAYLTNNPSGNPGAEAAYSLIQPASAGYQVKNPAHYTDYTQMTLAIAEMVSSNKNWDLDHLASQLLEVVRRDPRAGDARKFWRFLQSMGQQDCQADIFSRNDPYRAAVRTVPIGYYQTVGEVISLATVQASLVGDNPSVRDLAIAIALMAHYCLYNLGPKAKLSRYVQSHVPHLSLIPHTQYGNMNIHAAMSAIECNNRMSDLFNFCVTYAADLKVSAMIAMAVGACSQEILADLPDDLINSLEEGPYGRSYLQQLDQSLSEILHCRAMEA